MPRAGDQDEIWDALTDEFGPALTSRERSRRNGAVKELREAGVTPEQIKIAVAYCRRNFTQFSEYAVCNWIGRAVHEETQRGADVRSIFERMESR